MKLTKAEKQARKAEKRRQEEERRDTARDNELKAILQRAVGDTGVHQVKTGKAEIYIGKAEPGRVASIALKSTRRHPLDEYLSRWQITPAQHRAGRRIASDWMEAGLSGYPQRILERRDTIGLQQSERRAIALQAYFDALDAMGSIGSYLAVSVCCHGYHLRGFQYSHYKLPHTAMPRLKEALDDLADHYERLDMKIEIGLNEAR